MSILISHNSSLERLRAIPPRYDTSVLSTIPFVLAEHAPKRGELARLDIQSIGLRQRPLHQLVGSNAHISKARNVKTHVCGLSKLPAGLVSELLPGIYACGPALTFIQMARSLTQLGAIVLGYELCGSYSHFAPLVSGFFDRPPLTSVTCIAQSLSELESLYGSSHAKRALPYIIDGSASPMETVLSCMLSLPAAWGGFSYISPQLNIEVPLDEVSSSITGTKSCRVDVGFSVAKIGFEFDGADSHPDPERDRKRREALAHEGWTIFVITNDDVRDFVRLKKVVDLVGDRVPFQRGTVPASDSEASQLLQRLLRATRYGLGLHAALFTVPVEKRMVRLHL